VRTIELDPSNVTYRLDAAYVFMLQQQPDNALKALKEAEDIATTPADLAKVRSRRDQIEQSQAAMAKYKADQTAEAAHTNVIIETPSDNPHFPTAAPTGPQHIATGIVRNVQCYYPAILSLDLESSGKSVTYYTNDYLKVDYYNMNFVPKGSLDPCKDIDGMKATIHYTDVPNTPAPNTQAPANPPAGQIVKIALTKLP